MSHQNKNRRRRQRSRLPSIASLACSGALLQLEPQVLAVAIDDLLTTSSGINLAQVSSEHAPQFSQEELMEGMLGMAQNGVIRIPIKKEETGFLSQMYAQSGAESLYGDSWQNLPATATHLAQTYDPNDIDQLRSAVELGQLSNVQVLEPLTNSQNLSYIGELYIGSGTPQKVRAIFDTGSANPWILAEQGTKSMKKGLEIHPFDPKKSTSFKEPPQGKKHWVKISFGSGKIRGYFVEDRVTLGSPTEVANQLAVPNWTFGMVVDHTVFNGKFDALVGMAYPQFAEKGVTPLFDGLMQSGQLAKNVFSWYLSYNPDEESEILLGGWDTNRFTGDIQWHPVMHKLFWSIKLDDIKIGGVSTGFCTRPGANCLVCPDSGTSLATFPQAHFDQFQKNYGDVVSCHEGDELTFPPMVYVIDGIDYEMPSHHWVTRKIDPTDSKGGKCGNMIKPLGVNQKGLEEMHILGDVFMQLFYTIHDRDQDRVGFAKAVHKMPEVLVQFNTQGVLASVKTLQEDNN